MVVSCGGAGTPAGAIAHSIVSLYRRANGVCRDITVVNGQTGRVSSSVGARLSGGLRRFTSMDSGLSRIFRGHRRVRVSHFCRGLPGPSLVTARRFASKGMCFHGPVGRGRVLSWLLACSSRSSGNLSFLDCNVHYDLFVCTNEAFPSKKCYRYQLPWLIIICNEQFANVYSINGIYVVTFNNDNVISNCVLMWAPSTPDASCTVQRFIVSQVLRHVQYIYLSFWIALQD